MAAATTAISSQTMAKQNKSYSFRLKAGVDPQIREWIEIQDNLSESIVALISNWVAHNGVSKLKFTYSIVQDSNREYRTNTTTAVESDRKIEAPEKIKIPAAEAATAPAEQEQKNRVNAAERNRDVREEARQEKTGEDGFLGTEEIESFNNDDLAKLF